MNNSLYPNAIEANREGRFSWAQAGSLAIRLLLGSFSILLGLISIPFYLPLSLVSLVFGYLYAGNILIDLAHGSVLHVEGTGKTGFSRFPGSRLVSLYYRVNGVKLNVTSIFLHFRLKKLNELENVRAYYLPHSKVLVNLEW